jgi:hypothetical protein
MDESIPLSVLAIIFDGGQLVTVFYSIAAISYPMVETATH